MKRLCLFAHYDRDGIIDDYVIYYLKGLRNICERILLVSDCDLLESEESKLAGLAELVSASRHGEYDYGSWKRAYQFSGGDLAHYDELVLANDSCYAPIYSFNGVFDRMIRVEADVWSPTATLDLEGKLHHLNSYFLVLKPAVFNSASFREFLVSVKKENTKNEIVAKYELGLTRLLVKDGFKLKWIFAESDELLQMPLMHGRYYNKTVHSSQLSWAKVVTLKENPNRILTLRDFIKNINHLYPTHFIIKHLARCHKYKDLSQLKYQSSILIPHVVKIPFINRVIFQAKLKKAGWMKYYLFIFGFKVPVFIVNTRWFAAR